ncbi:MAG TPA: hypothetical protein VN517_14595 [Terriglobales bacterium]|nr:hypothetical protein [Terriglobales bacterium]
MHSFTSGTAESDGQLPFGERSLFDRPDEMRGWGMKSALSLIDQALTSGTSLGVNVLLALWLTPVAYGAFAVAFAAYLFLAIFHNALVLEPSVVIGPAHHAHQLFPYFRAQIRLHALLVWPLTGIALAAALLLSWIAPHVAVISALMGGGLALPLLLLLWLARRLCYALQTPSLAALGSSIYLVVSFGSLISLHVAGRLTPSTAFFALGLGSLAGACLILRRTALAGPPHSDTSSLTCRTVLSENWRYGRWLVGSAFFYAISTSVQTFLVAGIVGLDAAGVLRAMQIPSLVMTQIIASLGLLVLPVLSYDFGTRQIADLRQKATLVSLGLGLLALAFAGLLVLVDVPLENLLFHRTYADFVRIIPLLALIPAANGLCAGFSLALRACQLSHCDLIANVFGASVSLTSALVLIPAFGVSGAAVSMVLSVVAMNVVTFALYLRYAQRVSAITVEGNAEMQEHIEVQSTTHRSPQEAI